MLYFKIIDGQEVISPCTTLKIDGRWVSNPTQEQIFADGWQIYTPPPAPPQSEPDYDSVVEAIKKMFSTDTEELTDEEALEVAALYPTWRSKIGTEVAVGTRLWDDGKLWKVIQPHTVQEDWRPADAVSLFVEVSIEEWPLWVQPISAETAYKLNAQVSWNDKHWISEVDNNTWEPGVYGWRQV